MSKFHCGSIELAIASLLILCRLWNPKNSLWILPPLSTKRTTSDRCSLFETSVTSLASIEKYGASDGIWFTILSRICSPNILINSFCRVGDVYLARFVAWLKWLARTSSPASTLGISTEALKGHRCHCLIKVCFLKIGVCFLKIGVCFSKIGVCFFENWSLFFKNRSLVFWKSGFVFF